MQSEMPIPEVAFDCGVDVGELQLAYQPVVDLVSGAVTCVEALVRWDHPTRGLLWPGEFLDDVVDPEAQRRVTGWVLNEAARAASFWRDEYPDQPITVAVNLSAHDLESPNLAAHLANVLRCARARARSARVGDRRVGAVRRPRAGEGPARFLP